jgi:hypothetical protein
VKAVDPRVGVLGPTKADPRRRNIAVTGDDLDLDEIIDLEPPRFVRRRRPQVDSQRQ